MNEQIHKELQQGKYVLSDAVPHCVHALGAIPKSGGGYQIITDCKRPLGQSINNHMLETLQIFHITLWMMCQPC